MPVNKVRRKGSYAPLSAHYYKDDAIADAGEAAELLYVRGLAFCADVLSDGFISDRQLERFVGVGMRDAPKRAKKLGEVGLWERVAGGWQVSGWLKWNRSKDDITELNRQDSDRKTTKPAQPEDDVPPPTDADAPPDSDPNPNGIRTESGPGTDRSPDGIPPRAHGRAQTPLHATPRHSSSAAADAPASPINAGMIVGAWTDAVKANGSKSIPPGMRGQVGSDAKELLDAGTNPEIVLQAAKDCGAKGFATLKREVVALQAAPNRNVRQIRPMGPGYDANGEPIRDPKSNVWMER